MPYGVLTFSGTGGVVGFQEKPQLRDIWVNSGFFVIEPRALDYIDGADQPWEEAPMNRLEREGHLVAFRHTGYWQCMDTPRDRELLDERLRTGHADRG